MKRYEHLLPEQDNALAERVAELDARIDLLEGDVALLCKAVGLAGLREKELLHRIGLPDDMLERDNSELLADVATTFQWQR